MRILKVALVATLLLVGAACSDDGGDGLGVSDDAKPYVDELSKTLKEEDDDEFQISDDQADCISATWIDILKPERLEENGVKPADLAEGGSDESISKLGLSKDEGNAMVDAYDDCGINLRETFLESLSGDDSTSDEQAKCLDDAIDEDLLRDFLVQGFTQGSDSLDADDPATRKFIEASQKCAPGG